MRKKKKSLLGPALMVVCTLFLATSQFLMKTASERFSLSIEGILLNWPFLAGLVIAGLAAVIMTVAFKHGDMSLLFPIIALSFVWTTFIAAVVFGEHIGTFVYVGIWLIIMGVIVLGGDA